MLIKLGPRCAHMLNVVGAKLNFGTASVKYLSECGGYIDEKGRVQKYIVLFFRLNRMEEIRLRMSSVWFDSVGKVSAFKLTVSLIAPMKLQFKLRFFINETGHEKHHYFCVQSGDMKKQINLDDLIHQSLENDKLLSTIDVDSDSVSGSANSCLSNESVALYTEDSSFFNPMINITKLNSSVMSPRSIVYEASRGFCDSQRSHSEASVSSSSLIQCSDGSQILFKE